MALIYEFEEGLINFELPFTKIKTLDSQAPFDVKVLPEGKYFYGFATLPIVDSDGDRFTLEAIEKASRNLTKAPYNKIFLSHNHSDIAIGVIIDTKIVNNGLMILARLNENHERADEVWKSIQEGYLDSFSVGGSFLKVETEYDEKLKRFVRVVKDAIFREVSLTSMPANPQALVLGAFEKMKKLELDFTKPFAGYKDFADCVAKNQDKENPEGYCATIMRQVEGKTTSENLKYSIKVEKEMENQEQSQEQVSNEVKEEVKVENSQTENSQPEQKQEEKPIEVKEEQEKPVETKEEPKQETNTPLLDLLRKQIEELQKSIDLLKKENEELKKQLNTQLNSLLALDLKKNVRESVVSNSQKFPLNSDSPKRIGLLEALRGNFN